MHSSTSVIARLPRVHPVAVLVLLLGVILWRDSPIKPFWHDEVGTAVLAGDPGLFHMLSVLTLRWESSPPLYYIIIWTWTQIFGHSELAFRSFSTLCMGGAAWLLWRLMEPRFGRAPAALSLAAVFLASSLVQDHVIEARFYGWLLLLQAAGLHLLLHLTKPKPLSHSRWGLVAILFCMAATHVFGVLHGVVLLATLAITDLQQKRFRPGLLIAGGAALLPGVLWMIFCGVRTEQFRNDSWIPRPSPQLVYDVITAGIPVLIPAGVLLLFYLLYRRNSAGELPESIGAESPPAVRGLRLHFPYSNFQSLLTSEYSTILLWSILFLLATIVMAIESTFGAPLFWARYFIPLVAVWTLAFAATVFRWIPRDSFSAEIAALVLMAALSLRPLHPPLYDITGHQDAKAGYADLPLVIESPHLFWPRSHYAGHAGRYYYITDLDTEQRIRSAGGPGPDAILPILEEHYPTGRIVSWENFSGKHDAFLVLDSPDLQWFEKRITGNPAYVVSDAGSIDGFPLRLVKRR